MAERTGRWGILVPASRRWPLGLALFLLLWVSACALPGEDDGLPARASPLPNDGSPPTAVVAGGVSPDAPAVSPTSTPTPGPPNTPVPVHTSQAPTSIFPSPTPLPGSGADVIADAGRDKVVDRGSQLSLDGRRSRGLDGSALAYEWTQVHGPDVTDGRKVLTGPTPVFTAPQEVGTVVFELRVNGGSGDSALDTVQIDVVERPGKALFVNGDSGSDESGDGSREHPFSTISHALASVPGPDYDVYVMTRAHGRPYVETGPLRVQESTSLYGGYGLGWLRDVEHDKTRLRCASTCIELSTIRHDVWISGFDLSAADGDVTGRSVFGIRADGGTGTLHIQDNVIVAGDAPSGGPAGSSYSLFVARLDSVVVRRNVIISGAGGTGGDGAEGTAGRARVERGRAASGYLGGSGGRAETAQARGGQGGDGGPGTFRQRGDDGGGPGGGPGGNLDNTRGGDGAGGRGGPGGAGGHGLNLPGAFEDSGLFVSPRGTPGQDGAPGSGGAGGGGGWGAGRGTAGGGGGGGGASGDGGIGGQGGYGGGASVGVLLLHMASATLEGNVITAGRGGAGGNGGRGGLGQSGAGGGPGVERACPRPAGCPGLRSGDGGSGGGGGGGGQGGQGGGGTGGSSFGVLIGPGSAAFLEANTIASGIGGPGGAGGAPGLDGAPATGPRGGEGGGTCCTGGPRGAAGSPAAGGWSYAVFDWEPGEVPLAALSGNTLSHGSSGGARPGNTGATNF